MDQPTEEDWELWLEHDNYEAGARIRRWCAGPPPHEDVALFEDRVRFMLSFIQSEHRLWRLGQAQKPSESVRAWYWIMVRAFDGLFRGEL